MDSKKLIAKLWKLFPSKIAKEYCDHVGLMTGKLKPEIHKIVLALDMDWEIFDEVLKVKPDLVITHHPFIYGTRKEVFENNPSRKKLALALDEANIPVYSFHTNFDGAKGGMNDALAEALELKDVYAPEIEPMMRIGYLEKEMNIYDFAKYAKEKLNVDYGLLIDRGPKTIKKVGVLGGAGGGCIWSAQKEGVDFYISGDAPHHVRRDIVNENLNYMDVPHEVESIFVPTMAKYLRNMDNSLEIIQIIHEKMPKVI